MDRCKMDRGARKWHPFCLKIYSKQSKFRFEDEAHPLFEVKFCPDFDFACNFNRFQSKLYYQSNLHLTMRYCYDERSCVATERSWPFPGPYKIPSVPDELTHLWCSCETLSVPDELTHLWCFCETLGLIPTVVDRK